MLSAATGWTVSAPAKSWALETPQAWHSVEASAATEHPGNSWCSPEMVAKPSWTCHVILLMGQKSCTSWYGKYPIICRVLYIPCGAGILPSTVRHVIQFKDLFHLVLSGLQRSLTTSTQCSIAPWMLVSGPKYLATKRGWPDIHRIPVM